MIFPIILNLGLQLALAVCVLIVRDMFRYMVEMFL